jgi:hypothetical protein
MVRRQAIRRWICEPKRKPFWAKYHSLQRRDLPHSTPVAIVQWVGDNMTQTGKPLNQTQKAALDVRILKDVSWTPFLAVAGFKAHSAPSSSQSGKGCKQWRVSNSDAHDSLSACAGRSPRGGGSVARQYRHRRDRRLASAPARGQRSFAPAGARR